MVDRKSDRRSLLMMGIRLDNLFEFVLKTKAYGLSASYF